VVAVLGAGDLGPQAVVHGDVVTVGVTAAEGLRIPDPRRYTEISLGEFGARINAPSLDG
jgi:hypothetical protein